MGFLGVLSSTVAHFTVGDRPRWSVPLECSKLTPNGGTRQIPEKVLTSNPNRDLFPVFSGAGLILDHGIYSSANLEFENCLPRCLGQGRCKDIVLLQGYSMH